MPQPWIPLLPQIKPRLTGEGTFNEFGQLRLGQVHLMAYFGENLGVDLSLGAMRNLSCPAYPPVNLHKEEKVVAAAVFFSLTLRVEGFPQFRVIHLGRLWVARSSAQSDCTKARIPTWQGRPNEILSS